MFLPHMASQKSPYDPACLNCIFSFFFFLKDDLVGMTFPIWVITSNFPPTIFSQLNSQKQIELFDAIHRNLRKLRMAKDILL